MKYNPDSHRRRSIRLKGYDYSQEGAYFVTICVQNKACLFGDVVNEKMVLNEAGRMIVTQWHELPGRFNGIQLDEYVVMPNHFHGIIFVETSVRAPTRGAPTCGDIIGAFKSITTCEYIDGVKNHNWLPFDEKFWQRNYYEHVIRNERSLNEIREYIVNNPANWQQDELFNG